MGIYDFYDNIENAHEISKQILLTTRAKGIFCNSMMGTIGMAHAAGELNPEKKPFMIGYDFNEEIETCIRENILYRILFQSPFSQVYCQIETGSISAFNTETMAFLRNMNYYNKKSQQTGEKNVCRRLVNCR